MDQLRDVDDAKTTVTYSRKLSGGLFGRSGGVHYDIDLRICMHHECKIDRQPVYESVRWLAGLLGVSHHRCRKSWIRGVVHDRHDPSIG